MIFSIFSHINDMISCVTYKIDKLIDQAKLMQHRPELSEYVSNLLGQMNRRLTLKIIRRQIGLNDLDYIS